MAGTTELSPALRHDLSPWLLSGTPPAWARIALDSPDETLCDHAHCEKKAAASAIALINAYPGDGQLVSLLAALASEELEHFREIFALVSSRGGTLPRDAGDPYVQRLMDSLRQPPNLRKTDRLLVSALIEARSCERFLLLESEAARRAGEAPSDMDWQGLAVMFGRFADSEAGHAAMFTGLARRETGHMVDARLDELRIVESEIVEALPLLPRIH